MQHTASFTEKFLSLIRFYIFSKAGEKILKAKIKNNQILLTDFELESLSKRDKKIALHFIDRSKVYIRGIWAPVQLVSGQSFKKTKNFFILWDIAVCVSIFAIAMIFIASGVDTKYISITEDQMDVGLLQIFTAISLFVFFIFAYHIFWKLRIWFSPNNKHTV